MWWINVKTGWEYEVELRNLSFNWDIDVHGSVW